MKINSENILLNPPDYIKKIKVFLITGNEETLIDKISELLISTSKNYLQSYKKFDNKNINKDSDELFIDSLFEKSKVIIHSNPKIIDLEFLDLIEKENLLLIIKDSKIKKANPVSGLAFIVV